MSSGRPCAWCGRRCTAKTGVCRSCTKVLNGHDVHPDDELCGGAWVTRRGVQRWVEYGDGAA